MTDTILNISHQKEFGCCCVVHWRVWLEVGYEFCFAKRKRNCPACFPMDLWVKGRRFVDRKSSCNKSPQARRVEPRPCYSETGLSAAESAAKYFGISLPLFSCVDLGLTSRAQRPEDDITLGAIRSWPLHLNPSRECNFKASWNYSKHQRPVNGLG